MRTTLLLLLLVVTAFSDPLSPFTPWLQDNCIYSMYNSDCPYQNGLLFLPTNPDICTSVLDAINPYSLANNTNDTSVYRVLPRNTSCFTSNQTGETGNGIVLDLDPQNWPGSFKLTKFTFRNDPAFGELAPRVYFNPNGASFAVIQAVVTLSYLADINYVDHPEALNANFSLVLTFDTTPVSNSQANSLCDSNTQNVTAYKILGGNITGRDSFLAAFSISPSGVSPTGSSTTSGWLYLGYNQTGVNELYGLSASLKLKFNYGYKPGKSSVNQGTAKTIENSVNSSATPNAVLRMNLACPCVCFNQPVGTPPPKYSAAVSGPNADRPDSVPDLQWDGSLFTLSKVLATQCQFEPAREERQISVQFSSGSADVNSLLEATRGDKVGTRAKNFRYYLSTNSAASLTLKTIGDADLVWRSEKANYDCANNTCAPGKKCNHYIQTVSERTKRTGCYVATCTNNNPFGKLFTNWYHYVCVYDAASGTSKSLPYDAASCPSK